MSMEKKKRRQKKKNKYLSLPVLFIGLAATFVLELCTCSYIAADRKKEAKLEAEARMTAIAQEFRSCVAVTDSMALLIIASQGRVDDFEYMARMIADQNAPISSLQLAPQGKVEYIYPEKGNEAGKIDLFTDPDRKKEAEYARDTGETTVAGPFELKQGGNGMAVRKPVYLSTSSTYTKEDFWGFTIVILMTDKLLKEAHLDRLTTYGFHYKLTQTFDERTAIVSKNFSGILHSPVVEKRQLYGKDWTLEMEPAGGWVDWLLVILSTCVLVTVTVLAAALVRMSGRVRKHRIVLAGNSASDGLTGLLNRSGFDEMTKLYLAESEERGYLIAIDVNDFHAFNDRFGREAGDRLLVSLAADLYLMGGKEAILSRNGGDEFQMFLKQAAEGPRYEKIQSYVGGTHTFTYRGKEYEFTVAAGYATFPEQACELTDLCRRADRALCRSRKDALHRLVKYSEEED